MEAVAGHLEDWGCGGRVIGMCYDTTASNTGVDKGSAVLLQQEYFLRPILYIECRHHVGELLGKRPWEAIMKYDNGPEFSIYNKLRDIWPDIDIENTEITILDIPDDDEKKKLLDFFDEILDKKDENNEIFVRGDYREVALISRFMIAGELRGGEKMKWSPPSSTSKARFLAQGLCSQKLLAFSKSQIVKEKIFSNRVNVGTEKKKKWILVEDTELLARLKRYTNYAVRFYVQYFLTASMGIEAAVTDLKLFKDLESYKLVDEVLAKEAQKTLLRHRAYLAPQMVMIALWSEKLDEDSKSRMASRLLSIPRKADYKFGLPSVPNITSATQIWDCVTSESWEFFDILKQPATFLAKPVNDWEEDDVFIKIGRVVRTMKVVNDCAERGIALAKDYARCLTTDGEQRRMLYQVVEAARRKRSGCNKRDVNLD